MKGYKRPCENDIFILCPHILIQFQQYVQQYRNTISANGGEEGNICVLSIERSLPAQVIGAFRLSEVGGARFAWERQRSNDYWSAAYDN